MKILNLYAGIGGNRKLWGNEHKVTAIENNPEIAKIYQDFFPNDKVMVVDAHQFLLDHYSEFDFIWSSPPCPSHSQFRQRCGVTAWGQKEIYPDMKLYEEIIFLKYHFKGKWVVENVEPYYNPLIPAQVISRHFFWANFIILKKEGFQSLAIKSSEIRDLQKMHDIDLSNYSIENKRQILRNCVHSGLGRHVFDCAFKNIQIKLSFENREQQGEYSHEN